MSKAQNPKIVSANDLLEGDVVYMTATGGWTRTLCEAAVAATNEHAKVLLEHALEQADRIVGPYLADVVIEDGVPRPSHFREVFRDLGPTTRPDLGRQAERIADAHAHTPTGAR